MLVLVVVAVLVVLDTSTTYAHALLVASRCWTKTALDFHVAASQHAALPPG